MSNVKKYEAEIMKLYEYGMERTMIIEHIAIEYGLTYREAEPIVRATISRWTGNNKRAV